MWWAGMTCNWATSMTDRLSRPLLLNQVSPLPSHSSHLLHASAVTKKLKAFKAPAVSPAGGSRVHPYASSAGSRFVRRGGFQSADVKEEDEDGDRKPLITRNHLVSAAEVAAAEKPEAKKTKYSLF